MIAYSLGNFVGNGTLNLAGAESIGAVLRATLRRDGSWAGGALRSLRLLRPGVPVVDGENRAASLVRSLSQTDFGRRAMQVSRAGALTPPS